MSFLDYEAPTRSIPLGKGSFNVRGLSSDDVGQLISRNLGELTSVYDKLVKGNAAEVAQTLVATVVSIPRLATSVIMLGLAEEGDQSKLITQVSKLPMGTQFEALTAICELTFEDAGGLGKFLVQVKSMVQVVRQPGANA